MTGKHSEMTRLVLFWDLFYVILLFPKDTE